MKKNNFSSPILGLIALGCVIYIWKMIIEFLNGKIYGMAQPADEANGAENDDESIANATTGMADEAVQPEEQ